MGEIYKMRDDEQADGLLSMINDLGDTKNMIMIEIGSYLGESTIMFAQKFKKVITIDPFINNYDDSEYPIKYEALSVVYEKFLKNISVYNNIFHIRKKSDDAIFDIIDEVDFVYIDGHHTYEQVKKDIINYKKVIKDGGIIGGHDFCDVWEERVVKAVVECLGMPDNVYKDFSWVKKIKKNMVNTFFDKIFYINLAKDTERDKFMLSQFKEFGITNFERYEAVVYNQVPEHYLWRNFIKTDEKYVKGQLGCRESMLNIIKLSKQRGYKNILILEDDAYMLNNPNDIMYMNQLNLEIADMFYFGGTIEPHYRGQVVCAHACGIKHTLFDDIINMSVASGMEMDNFYAKIIQHMSYNYNPRGQYNVMMLHPFNTIIQNKDFASNIQNRGDLIQLTDMVKQYFIPKTFMEIGSKDGQDTKYITEYWKIDKDNAYVIEANKYCHAEIAAELLKNPYATLIFGAASNTDGEVEFNCVISDDKELVGVSSIKKSMVINNLQYQQTIVPCFRLENLIKKHNIELLKIDVEGHAYEVLQGIGQQLQNVKAIQVETEITYAFENQKLDEQVHEYLQNSGFVLVDKQRCWEAQYDCLYIHNTLLK